MQASYFMSSSLVLAEQASATLPACTASNKGTILSKKGGGLVGCDGLSFALPTVFVLVVWVVFSSSPAPLRPLYLSDPPVLNAHAYFCTLFALPPHTHTHPSNFHFFPL